MTKQQFIEAIAIAAQKYAPQYGIKVVSPIIAQACLESAYGTSSKAKYHNYFGLKYRKNRVTCNNGYFQDSGSEQSANGSYTPINTDWYAFDSLDSGVHGYFQFINISNYANLKGVTDPKQYLENIKADGYATSLNYVNNVYKVIISNNLTQYDKKEVETMSYTNSDLVDIILKSPNNSGQRTHTIDRITPHCVVGQLSASAIGGCFTSESRKASCNYGIGTDGKVVLVVDESNRSWCSSSNANDQRAVTIECASDKTTPYAFNDTVYNKLIDLCVDICKRNNKTKLLWLEDKTTSLNYSPKSNEMVLTVHRWFANKACPGDWLMGKMNDLASKVTAKLAGTTTTSASSSVKTYPTVPFTVKVLVDDLNYRATASNNGIIKGQAAKGVYTITEVSGNWGKLKGNGYWIYLANENYVTILNATSTATAAKIVQVTASALNVRKGPGTNYGVTTIIRDKGKYTIVDEENGWGLLKSYEKNRNGWINLSYTKEV